MPVTPSLPQLSPLSWLLAYFCRAALAPTPVQLTETERSQLQQLVNRHGTPQQIALRARIILLAAQGLNHRDIARELGISRDMARLWRNRWMELSVKNVPVVERLADAPRPGGPMTFSLEQILQLASDRLRST